MKGPPTPAQTLAPIAYAVAIVDRPRMLAPLLGSLSDEELMRQALYVRYRCVPGTSPAQAVLVEAARVLALAAKLVRERRRRRRSSPVTLEMLALAATEALELVERPLAISPFEGWRQERQIGIVLALLGHVIEAFNAAHRFDPSVPKLQSPMHRRALWRAISDKRDGEGARLASRSLEPRPSLPPA